MTIRTALRQSRVLTYAVLFVLLWLLVTLYRVATSFDWTAITTPTFIGLNPVGGIVGVVVMAIVVMLVIALYGELSQEEPAPEPWPPTE
jgi:apolipoprotein N-acyltransferase